MNILTKLTILLFPCIFLGIGILCISNSVNNMQRNQAAQSWDSTVATITASKMSSHRTSTDSSTYYSADIQYTYTVDDVDYTGDRIRLGSINSSRESTDHYLKQFSTGSRAAVYYNPEDPQDAALEIVVDGSTIMPIFAGTAFSIIGSLFLFSILRNFRTFFFGAAKNHQEELDR